VEDDGDAPKIQEEDKTGREAGTRGWDRGWRGATIARIQDIYSIL
jgi:hypothetical protein